MNLGVNDTWSSTVLRRQRDLIVNEIRCYIYMYIIVVVFILL